MALGEQGRNASPPRPAPCGFEQRGAAPEARRRAAAVELEGRTSGGSRENSGADDRLAELLAWNWKAAAREQAKLAA